MSEPIIYLAIGFLLAALLVFSVRAPGRARLRRLAAKRIESPPSQLIADIESDMGELHAQIAGATRRLETTVEEMKTRTTGQLSEIGRSNDAIARLKTELVERSTALEALAAKHKELQAQLRATEAELAVKTAALADVNRKLTWEKAELSEVMTFAGTRDKRPKSDRHQAAALDASRTQNLSLEEELRQSHDQCAKLEQELANMKRQVEATWATERMANAVLRERINDVANEVVRVAHALEGLGSPIDMLADRASELSAPLGAAASSAGGKHLTIAPGGNDSKGSLAYRIRSLQKRSERVASDGKVTALRLMQLQEKESA
jgi:chromosome segregation ATPase